MNKLTKEQAVIISAYTGIVCCAPFSLVHEYVEKKMGRPVFTHEMGDEKIALQIQAAAKDDFVALCYREEKETQGEKK